MGIFDNAANYHQLGWSIIPLEPRGKKPLIKWEEYQNRLPTSAELQTWQKQFPNCNLGIVTGRVSGLIILDVDSAEGEAELQARGIPPTLVVKTGKGRHLYFKHPGGEIHNFTRKLPGLDLRGDGGYVVAPPSIHESGKTYAWEISPMDASPTGAPEWILDLCRNGPSPQTPIMPGESISEGQRNDTLYRHACRLRNIGMEYAEILPAIQAMNRARCNPPLEEDELQSLTQSACRFEPGRIELHGDAMGDPSQNQATTAVKEPSGQEDTKREKRSAPTDDELRDRWIAKNGTTAFGLGDWRRYYQGIWDAIDDARIKDSICGELEEAKGEGIRPSAALVTSVTNLALWRLKIGNDMWDSYPDILVCSNGALSISTGELSDHDPKHYATSRVAYAYDPNARCPNWDRLISDLRNWIGDDVVDFLQEFAGYALTTDCKYEVAVWLHGKPGSAKSTFITGLLAALDGRAGTLSLRDIERSRFALSNLPGKTLVTSTEQPGDFMAATDVLNALISGEPISIEQKFKAPYDLIPRCKLLWAMNDLPRVANPDDGVFRRVKVVEFPEVPKHLIDVSLKENIKLEGAGILNWAIIGLRRLVGRGRFNIPDSVVDATTNFREDNDIPARFSDECCILGADANGEPLKIRSSQLYQAYKEWCINNGHKPKSSTAIASDWKRLGFEQKRASDGVYWLWAGLRALHNM